MSLNPNENGISVWNKRQNSGKMKKKLIDLKKK